MLGVCCTARLCALDRGIPIAQGRHTRLHMYVENMFVRDGMLAARPQEVTDRVQRTVLTYELIVILFILPVEAWNLRLAVTTKQLGKSILCVDLSVVCVDVEVSRHTWITTALDSGSGNESVRFAVGILTTPA